MRKINKIILHCSTTPEGKDFKAIDIDRWHKNQGWQMIGYHYVVDLDGTIENGRPVEMAGAHTKGHNSNSIGICYIGGLDESKNPKDTRTPMQKESLYLLVYQLMTLYDISINDVFCHNQFANRACPSFTIEQFKDEFSKWMESYYKLKDMSK